jgi:hypothetical protein
LRFDHGSGDLKRGDKKKRREIESQTDIEKSKKESEEE